MFNTDIPSKAQMTITVKIGKKITSYSRWKSKRSWKRWRKKAKNRDVYRKITTEIYKIKMPNVSYL